MRLEKDIEKILIDQEALQKRTRELAEQITKDYEGKPLTVVATLKGAVLFFSDLVRWIDLPLQLDFMRVSSYGSGTRSSGAVQIIKDLDADVTGRHILIVEDIVDTGNTLAYLYDYLINRGAVSVRICTLLEKTARRERKVNDDYTGFFVPDEFVVGYGLDYAEDYRNLPFVGVLKRSVYEK